MIPSASLLLMLVLSGGGGNHLLDYAATEVYWKDKGVAVSLEAMSAELKVTQEEDLTKLIADLASDSPQTRREASNALEAKGRAALAQLQQAAQSPDPQVAAAAKGIIRKISQADKAAGVRRLMAIRTLGEMKNPAALPLLKQLAASPEPFVGEYAQRAVAAIEGKDYVTPALPPAERMADANLLPSGCALVAQQMAAGAKPETIEAIFKGLPDFPGMDKAEVLGDVTREVVKIAEQTGDIRFDAATVGVSGDVGPNSGFVVIVGRGQCDAEAVAALLEKTGEDLKPKMVEGMKVFAPDDEVAFFFPSPERVVFMAGDNKDQLPLDAMIKAVRAGKGALSENEAVMKLIKAAPTDQSAWGVAVMTPSFREAPILKPFDTIVMGAKREGDAVHVTLKGEGNDADAVAGAVKEINAGIQMGIQQMQQMGNMIPKAVTEPMVKLMQGIKCTSEGKSASMTLSAERNMAFSVMGMFFGISAHDAAPAQEAVPPQP